MSDHMYLKITDENRKTVRIAFEIDKEGKPHWSFITSGSEVNFSLSGEDLAGAIKSLTESVYEHGREKAD